MKKYAFILIILNIVIFINTNINYAQKMDEVIAVYADTNKITISDLLKYYKDYNYDRMYKNELSSYNNILNIMVQNRMKRLDFIEKRMYDNIYLIKNIGRTINEETIVKYFNETYLNKYCNEENALSNYKIFNKIVHFSSIDIEIPNNMDSLQKSVFDSKIEKLKNDFQSYNNLDKIIKKYKNIIKIKNHSKSDEIMYWRQSLLNDKYELIFNLNLNETMLINETKICKIVRVNKVVWEKSEPYEDVKEIIYKEMNKKYTEKSILEFEKEKGSIIDTSLIIWNEIELNKILRYSENQMFFVNEYKNTLNKEINKENNIILSNNLQKISFSDFLNYLDNILIINIERKLTISDLKKYFIEALKTEVILNRAKEKNYHIDIIKNYDNNPIIKEKILQLYNIEEIENKIPELTEESRLKFYNINKDSIFYQLNKVIFLLKIFDTANEAKQIVEKIRSGTAFEKTLNGYLVRTYIKSKNGEIKSVLKNEKPIFSDYVFGMKENEISDVIKFNDQDNKEKYAVIKCANSIPEKQLTFEESKKSLDEEYKKYYYNKIDKEIIEKLVEKYKPVYHYDVLEKHLSGNK